MIEAVLTLASEGEVEAYNVELGIDISTVLIDFTGLVKSLGDENRLSDHNCLHHCCRQHCYFPDLQCAQRSANMYLYPRGLSN